MGRQDFAAMDDMAAYAAGHHAESFARANLHMLQDECGIVRSEPESRVTILTRRIAMRQGLLASGPMHQSVRRRMEDANELDAQELALHEAMANDTAADVGAWIVNGVCLIAAIAMGAHLIATNWGL